MDASVLICTYNRAESLARTLDSLCRLRIPTACAWEVVVIDNACTDQTPTVANRFRGRLPLRLGHESTPGKSHALNSGLDLCSGRVIFLTDDDVEVDRGWLDTTLATFVLSGADAVFGRILPLWPHMVPDWYSPHLAPALALLDYGPRAFDLQPSQEGFFGANVAITRRAIDDVGRWSTVLNRAGKGLIMGEDSEICRRLLEAGKHVRYEPVSIVHHDVGAARLRKDYFRRWFMAHGQSSVLRGAEFPADGGRLGGMPLYLFRMAVGFGLRSLAARLKGDKADALAGQMRLCRVLGAMHQFRRGRDTGGKRFLEPFFPLSPSNAHEALYWTGFATKDSMEEKVPLGEKVPGTFFRPSRG